MLRPNTTIDVTTLPAPEAGLEGNGTVDGLRPTMVRGNVKGIVRRVKHNVSVRHLDASASESQRLAISSLKQPQPRNPKKCARGSMCALSRGGLPLVTASSVERKKQKDQEDQED